MTETSFHVGRNPDHVLPVSAPLLQIVELMQTHQESLHAVRRRPSALRALPFVERRIATAIDQMLVSRKQSPLLVGLIDCRMAGSRQIQAPGIVPHGDGLLQVLRATSIFLPAPFP